MKKALISFLSIVVLLGMFGMAQAYSTSADGGIWEEWYPIGEGPGSPGSVIYAYSVPPTPSIWTLDLLTLVGFLETPTIVNGEWKYTTQYADGILTWNGPSPIPPSLDVDAVVYAYISLTGEYLRGNIILTGGGFTMTGNLTEIEFWDDFHWGEITDVFITDEQGGPDIPVPEPATLLLLGFGLAGLAGVGRKYKS